MAKMSLTFFFFFALGIEKFVNVFWGSWESLTTSALKHPLLSVILEHCLLFMMLTRRQSQGFIC